jgi:N-dimethylarginine dimethylaminohydrolase
LTQTAQTEVGTIKRIVAKHARDAFVSQQSVAAQWRDLNYLGQPDFTCAMREYDDFIAILESFDIEIDLLPRAEGVGLDSIYVRDASIVCDRGVILCSMGKHQRRAEPEAQAAALAGLGLELLGRVSEPATIEGGDVVWLGDGSVVVGISRRTDEAGAGQLRDMLGDCVDQVVLVRLPDWGGPGDVFHLMSILSPIDHDLALVYSPLTPAPLREALLARGYRLVEVPDQEFATMGCNVLAVAPRRCVMLSGNPVTRARLERAGADVVMYDGAQISMKGAGGPTCLTRPIVREAGSGPPLPHP